MPATAGRVRMPANNRVHSSAALQTHGIWQSAIGYDPYAPNKEESKNSEPKSADPDNPYNNFQGLLALARITGSNADEARGACTKCGRVGHLTFQCRNFLSVKEEISKAKDDDGGIEAAMLEKWKGGHNRDKKFNAESEESSDEEESESSDSEYDSEIERAIAERNGKNSSKKLGHKVKRSSSDSKESRKRGRSKRRSGKRENDDSDDEAKDRRNRKKEKRRRRDESSSDDSDEELHRRKRKGRKEKRRRRSHRHSDDSDDSPEDSSPPRHKRRGRRTATSSDSACSSDELRVGRDKKRSEKRSRKHRHHGDD
ncbi:unnamed protein product [Cuscuta europaea]|uniref:CCHC-type domain-containing protein n=1 Tax=Cuscuta europaea TaxID=41803 RepID=A0A9P0YS19_CUSEU|nr:unnamed protein product [Cuscuta europaea]